MVAGHQWAVPHHVGQAVPARTASRKTASLIVVMNRTQGVLKAGPKLAVSARNPERDARAAPMSVTHATSFAELEEAARSPATKGIYWDRGNHPLEKDMERWASAQLESRESHSYEQLLISPLHGSENETGGGCGDPNHPCGWLNRAVAYEGERVASASDIQQACARLVEKLPASFRETVLEDAERLAATLMRLCPDSQWLTLAVEIIGKNCRILQGAYLTWQTCVYPLPSHSRYGSSGTAVASFHPP